MMFEVSIYIFHFYKNGVESYLHNVFVVANSFCDTYLESYDFLYLGKLKKI